MSSTTEHTLSGQQFGNLVRPLIRLEGEEYQAQLERVHQSIREVTTREPAGQTSGEITWKLGWNQFTRDYQDNLKGSHAENHAPEIAYPETLGILSAHSDSLQKFIEALPEVSLEDLTTFGEQCVRVGTATRADAQIPKWRKPVPEGYDSVVNLRFILNVPSFTAQARAVKVRVEDAYLAKRHDGTSYNFLVNRDAPILETKCISTMVVTYWVYLPKSRSGLDANWTFGTFYMGDVFPREKPDLLSLLVNQLNGGQHSLAQIKGLIRTDNTLYALLPPDYPLEVTRPNAGPTFIM